MALAVTRSKRPHAGAETPQQASFALKADKRAANALHRLERGAPRTRTMLWLLISTKGQLMPPCTAAVSL